MPAFAIIVPCRLESTRFPRKLLHPIKGKPLVLWVAERITAQAPGYPLWFAVDHPLLAECIEGAGFRAIMTDASHQSGTDRIAEANRTVRASYVLNVQPDEAADYPANSCKRWPSSSKATARWRNPLCTPFKRIVDFYNINQVKVVMSSSSTASAVAQALTDQSENRPERRALYFYGSPGCPISRDLGLTIDDAWVLANPCFKHLGLYAYKADYLGEICADGARTAGEDREARTAPCVGKRLTRSRST